MSLVASLLISEYCLFTLPAQPMVMILGGLAALLGLDLDSACGERLRPGQPAGMDRKDASGVVLLSVAAGDSRGLPDAETLQAVRGYSVLRTDMNGWIEITTDGEWK